MAAIQDFGQMATLFLLIAYVISFSKMYSFYTLCYLKAEILTKTCFTAAIL